MIATLVKILPNGKTWRTQTFDVKGAFLQTFIAECHASKAVRDRYCEPEDPIVSRMPDGRYCLLLAYVCVCDMRRVNFSYRMMSRCM